jgi:ATP-dependent RNA helicase RhlE
MPFSGLGLDPLIVRAMRELGFTRPTPVQQEAIPPAMAGRDVLACAMTGSGKTAAFLLPIMQRLLAKRRGTTRALVLTPTRELAAQIDQHLAELAVHTPLTGAAVFGGVGMGPQEHAFRSGVDLIVATPGRLLDHFRNPYARLAGLEVLVLDEADRMLDMGFMPDIRRILRHLPPRRQTLFVSATMPPPIVQLAGEMLKDPAMVNLQRKAAPATGITQAVYPVPQELKGALLFELLKRGDLRSILVFTRTKHRANRLAEFLERHRVPSARIHGNRTQAQRTAALAGFRAGRFRVLVATDIAARGIDVEALSHVVNFDVPGVPEDYIHRIGRTARAEATGDAFTFVAPDEEGDVRAIERAIGKRLPRITLPEFDYTKRSAERLEIPLGERRAALRARRSEERGRARSSGRPQPTGAAQPRQHFHPTGAQQRSGPPGTQQRPSESPRGPRPRGGAHGRPRRFRPGR